MKRRPSQRGRKLEAEGAESEGENQSWPSWRGRCGGGGVGGVEARGWQALGTIRFRFLQKKYFKKFMLVYL
jgi:hypothetical protein